MEKKQLHQAGLCICSKDLLEAIETPWTLIGQPRSRKTAVPLTNCFVCLAVLLAWTNASEQTIHTCCRWRKRYWTKMAQFKMITTSGRTAYIFYYTKRPLKYERCERGDYK